MTKRLTSALVCATALLTLVGTATADARPLPYRTAKVLAKRLAQQQVQGRDVVSWHLVKPHRLGPNRIVFLYDDRTSANVYCTANVIVRSVTRGRTTTTTARFAGIRCAGIPSEVLKFESATRHAQRQLRENTAEVLDRLDALKRSTHRCRNVKVPRSKRSNAKLLFSIAEVEALEQPNDSAIGDFVASLQAVNATSPVLADGAAGWADYLSVLRALPQIDDPCALLKAWAQEGYAASSAPIDFAAAHRLDRRTTVDQRAIGRAATLMAERGAFPNAAVGFTTEGLLTQASVRAGITGGSRKLAKHAFL
jgi:hypothetical protein